MIVMRLRGRLGNQLFIYCFGRALQEQYHTPLLLLDNENDTMGSPLSVYHLPRDVRLVSYRTGQKMDYYKMKAEDYRSLRNRLTDRLSAERQVQAFCKEAGVPSMSPVQQLLYLRYKLATRKKSRRACYEYELAHAETLARHGLLVCENGYLEFPSSAARDIFAFGYFQSEKYFQALRPRLLQELTPKQPMNPAAQQFAARIAGCESVCLSIRMGDYMNNPIHGVCSVRYYQAAVDKMYELHPHARIFVFSDDIAAVQQALTFPNEVIFEPAGNSEWEKLQYMSMCRHFILSNSSFSWWAQYLGCAPDKTVIAPSRWFAVDIPCDIFQDNWITL